MIRKFLMLSSSGAHNKEGWDVKSKILRLLALALLAGPMGANAAFVYSFYYAGWDVGFTFTTPSLLTETTDVFVFDSTNNPNLTSAQLRNPISASPAIEYSETTGGTSIFSGLWDGSWAGPGFYTWQPSATAAGRATLSIRETSSVPEPGTLALLGLGLAGMVLSRRRNTA